MRIRNCLAALMIRSASLGAMFAVCVAASAQQGPASGEIERPGSLQDAAIAMRTAVDAIALSVEKDALDAIPKQADTIGQYAKFLGRLAMDFRSGVQQEQVGTVAALGKEIASAAAATEAASAGGDKAKLTEAVTTLRAKMTELEKLVPQRWVCDMHCEGCKVLTAPGRCPVCKMPYRKFEEVGSSMKISSASAVNAGSPADLTFKVIDAAGCDIKGSTISVTHEHPVHAIIVSNDLSWYAHEHPKLQRDGTFKLDGFTFPAPGKYTIYSDFTPKGKVNVVSPFGLTVPGETPASKTWTEDFDVVNHIDSYEFRIRCNGQKFFAGEESFVRYGIDEGGKPVTDLEPLMGAMGHLVVLSADLKEYVHAHPLNDPQHDKIAHTHENGLDPEDLFKQKAYANGNGADVIFHVRFPKPGLYRLFAQFRHKGKTIVVPFTVDALEPEGGMKAAPPMIDHSKHMGASGAAH